MTDDSTPPGLRGYAGGMKITTTLLAAFILVSSMACENKDYKNCLENEKKSEAKYLDKVKACSDMTDATKRKDCLEQAELGHFKAGCEALK